MDVYIARQPIFSRNMRIYGYELLYRKSSVNSFDGVDDDLATTEVLYNSFLVVGLDNLTNGAKAFINFSKNLIDSEIPLLLPKDKVIVEILRDLGYQIALDDFVLNEANLPLLGYADIIKIEYPRWSLKKQIALLKHYKGKIKFLAEKIETREDFRKANELGYDYFQGYFFSKPKMINSKEIKTLNTTLFNIIDELNSEDPDFRLSYKLLKLANSVYIGALYAIKTIEQALAALGTRKLYQWISLMLIKDVQDVENTEIIKLSLIRGKLMSLLADELGRKDKATDYFFAGIFSFIDILLNRPMEDILTELPLSEDVKGALLGEPIMICAKCLIIFWPSRRRNGAKWKNCPQPMESAWADLWSSTLTRSNGQTRWIIKTAIPERAEPEAFAPPQNDIPLRLDIFCNMFKP